MGTYDAFVKYVYEIVKLDCEGMDAIYGDHIKSMFGVYGLNALHVNGLIEGCGSVNGRQLYALNTLKGDELYGINS